jgi:ribosomal protein L32
MSAREERPTLADVQREEHPPLAECAYCGRRAREGRECLACGAVDEEIYQCDGCGRWLAPWTDFIARVGWGEPRTLCEECLRAEDAERWAA